MQWSGERSGEYVATVPAARRGVSTKRASKPRATAQTLGTTTAHVRAAPGDAEYFDATMHAATLRRIAEETGGKFYDASAMQGLPEDLRYTGRGVTTVEERDLWDLPIVLMLLIGLLCAEWGYRRSVGLS